MKVCKVVFPLIEWSRNSIKFFLMTVFLIIIAAFKTEVEKIPNSISILFMKYNNLFLRSNKLSVTHKKGWNQGFF